jgi:signal transduction histidine kinase
MKEGGLTSGHLHAHHHTPMTHDASEPSDGAPWSAALIDANLGSHVVTTRPADRTTPDTRESLEAYRARWQGVMAAEDRAAAFGAFEAVCTGASDLYRTIYRLATPGVSAVSEIGLVVARDDDGRPSRLLIARSGGTPAGARPEARAIGHDLNNLLTAAVGYAEMLLEDTDPQVRTDDLLQLRDAVRRAADLVRQLTAR